MLLIVLSPRQIIPPPSIKELKLNIEIIDIFTYRLIITLDEQCFSSVR